MRLTYQFEGQTVKGQGWRRSTAYRVGRTRRPHCLFSPAIIIFDTLDHITYMLTSVVTEILHHRDTTADNFKGEQSDFQQINSSIIQGSGFGPATYVVNTADLVYDFIIYIYI